MDAGPSLPFPDDQQLEPSSADSGAGSASVPPAVPAADACSSSPTSDTPHANCSSAGANTKQQDSTDNNTSSLSGKETGLDQLSFS